MAIPAANVLPAASGNVQLTRVGDFANRSGALAVTYSDWNVGRTETETDSTNSGLNQSPLDSPTVFNFFLPDYQFPGVLSQAGLITPEFQLTSETSVIRQANFLYYGLFNDGLSQRGLSSFKNGGRDIFVDLRPWMGVAPGGLPWAHDSNLDAFIDELNTLLMAGQLDSTGTNSYGTPRLILNAKQAIRDYVTTNLPVTRAITSVSTAVGVPCAITINGHGLAAGANVTISGVVGGSFTPSINGTFTVSSVNTNTITIPVVRNNTSSVTLTGATISGASLTDLYRDRVRAIVHLLVTSPDFTIQK